MSVWIIIHQSTMIRIAHIPSFRGQFPRLARRLSTAEIQPPKRAAKYDHSIQLKQTADGRFESASSHDPELDIGKKILGLANNSYKQLNGIPEWLKIKVNEIKSMRTTNQKKRPLESLMQVMPSNNYELQVLYRNKPLGWRVYQQSSEITQPIVYGPMEAIVYTENFMPTRHQVLRRIMGELQVIIPSFKPSKVLDFGCGPGTGYTAALEIWGDKTYDHGIRKYTGIDASQSMLDIAKSVTSYGDVDRVFWNKSADVFQAAKSRGDRFDLIVLSYTLGEMPNDSMRRATTQLMTELLDTNGILIILEAGNPHGSNVVRSARQFVLNEFNLQPRDTQRNDSKKPNNNNNNNNSSSNNVNNQQNSSDGDTASDRPSTKFKFGSNYAVSGVVIKSHIDLSTPSSKETNSKHKFEFSLPAPYLTSTASRAMIENHHTSSSSDEKKRETTFGYFDFGVKVIAPCSHDKRCPLGPGVWCSFSQKVITVMNECMHA